VLQRILRELVLKADWLQQLASNGVDITTNTLTNKQIGESVMWHITKDFKQNNEDKLSHLHN
jgi:hypothetical protein